MFENMDKKNDIEREKKLGGQPPFYADPFELHQKIEAYFNGGAHKKKIVVGKGENKKEVEVQVTTISGLCYFLGFESRQSFYDYEKREGFSYIIKRGRLRIEQNYEEMLQLDASAAGSIFALKNMGWTDRTQTDLTSSDGSMSPTQPKTLDDWYNAQRGHRPEKDED